MKRSMLVTLFLICILASCASPTPLPSPTPSQTNTPLPTATSTATQVPMIVVGGIQVPDPKISNPEFFDLNDPNSLIPQFVNAMKVAEIDVDPQKVVDELTKNYQSIKGADGKTYVLTTYMVTDQNGTPYTIGLVAEQGINGKSIWVKETPALMAKIMGKSIIIRLGPAEQTSEIATKIKMETGDVYNIFNKTFDWSKVTTDWESVYQQLQQEKIPFENEIFDEENVAKVQTQITFANSHNLTFVGDALFYPSILKDPVLKNLNASQKREVLIFMALSRIIKFPETKEDDLISELAAYQQWQSDINPTFNEIGGLNFVHDLGVAVKQIRPDIKLIATEDMIINDQKSPAIQQNYDSFFRILQQLKENGTPLDEVKFENAIWVNAPPTEQSISIPLKSVQALGFGIAGPDTVIATGDQNPIWAKWPPTIKLVTPNQEQMKQAQILYLLFTTYFNNGASEIGFQSPVNPDWMGTNGNIFTSDGQPTLMFFALLSALSK